jgi:precorrin-8X/cobalt-precorrin-8 methylmutase
MSDKSFGIEQRSFEIIDSEIGDHQYGELEWAIVRRVIHSTADFEFSREARIIFQNDPISSSFLAIRRKCTIVTDVEMVLGAINKNSLLRLGLKTICRISDAPVAERSVLSNQTKAQLGMRHAEHEINGGIVVIGNSPSALYELISMIREGVSKPAVIIGVPVGFVSASESKEELRKLNTPLITNIGRKGGSSVAASIMNAIMLLPRSLGKDK